MKKVYKMTEKHKQAIRKAKLGHKHSEETKRKIGIANKGKVRSLKDRKRLSERMKGKTGKLGHHWLGEKVGMVGVHLWLRRIYGTPKLCEKCGTTDKNKIYDWACKNHNYIRRRNSFLRMCRSCHRKHDIKYNNYRVLSGAFTSNRKII